MTIEQKLHEMGLTLPDAPKPAGHYEPFIREGGMLYLSGQLPVINGEVQYAGAIGRDLEPEAGHAAARLCALNVLAQIKAALGSFDHLNQIVRLNGRVHCAPGFTDLAGVLDGASDFFAEVLGDKAGHARAATGHMELSRNVAVELVVTAAVRS